MTVEIRHALPEDAEQILALVRSDVARLGFALPAKITEQTIASLERKIALSTSEVSRVIALGEAGTVLAYMKSGPWKPGDENQFTSGILGRILNSAREFPDDTGLFTLAVSDKEATYTGPAVTELVEATNVFRVGDGERLKVPVAYPDVPEVQPFLNLLRRHGVSPTERLGQVALQNPSDEPVPAQLWQKNGRLLV